MTRVTLRSYRRCIVLNGINNPAFKPDILDRSIMIELERIPNTERKEESRLNAEWEVARPLILGGILDALAQAISIYPTVQCDELPRMADFARWGCAIAQALGRSQEDFLKAMYGNVELQNEEALSNHPIATAILGLMEDHDEWSGRATELLEALNGQAQTLKIDERDRNWPRSPQVLSRRLKEVPPNLQEAGLRVVRSKGTDRTITIAKIPSIASIAPGPLQDNNLQRDDITPGCADTGDSASQELSGDDSNTGPEAPYATGADSATVPEVFDATGDDIPSAVQIPSTHKSKKNNGAGAIDAMDGIFAKVGNDAQNAADKHQNDTDYPDRIHPPPDDDPSLPTNSDEDDEQWILI